MFFTWSEPLGVLTTATHIFTVRTDRCFIGDIPNASSAFHYRRGRCWCIQNLFIVVVFSSRRHTPFIFYLGAFGVGYHKVFFKYPKDEVDPLVDDCSSLHTYTG